VPASAPHDNQRWAAFGYVGRRRPRLAGTGVFLHGNRRPRRGRGVVNSTRFKRSISRPFAWGPARVMVDRRPLPNRKHCRPLADALAGLPAGKSERRKPILVGTFDRRHDRAAIAAEKPSYRRRRRACTNQPSVRQNPMATGRKAFIEGAARSRFGRGAKRFCLHLAPSLVKGKLVGDDPDFSGMEALARDCMACVPRGPPNSRKTMLGR